MPSSKGTETDEGGEPEEEEDSQEESSPATVEKAQIITVEEGGVVYHKCPYPGCNFKHKKLNAVQAHIDFKHRLKGEFLDASGNMVIVPATKRPGAKVMPKTFKIPTRRVTSTSGDAEESTSAASGQKAEIKGKLRQLLKAISESDPEQRDILMPTREVLMDYIKILSKANVSEEELSDISNNYEDKLRPEVEHVLGRDKVSLISKSPQAASKLPNLGMVTRMAKLRGQVKQYLGNIAKLPPTKRDELASERETLSMLNRRLMVKELAEEELADMEDVMESEVRPASDAIILATQKAPQQRTKDVSSDDIMGAEIQHKKEELDLRRMDRMLAEESMRHKQTLEAMHGGGSSNAMVPVMRPMIDENGALKRDKEGKPMMETTYAPVEQAGGMNNLLMTLMLSGKLGGGDNTTLLAAMMDNNTKILTALIQKDQGGGSTKELILQMQNENLKMMADFQNKMLEMTKQKGDDPGMTQMREELRATREAQERTRNEMYNQQLNYMGKEMEDLKRYAYRDSLEEILKQKSRLEELGVVSSQQKDVETKSLEETRKLGDKALDKVDRTLTEMKGLIQPFADAQGALLKAQIQQTGRPPLRQALTEDQKNATYRRILENIEQEEEEEQ